MNQNLIVASNSSQASRGAPFSALDTDNYAQLEDASFASLPRFSLSSLPDHPTDKIEGNSCSPEETIISREIRDAIIELVRESNQGFTSRLKRGLLDQDPFTQKVFEVIVSYCDVFSPDSLSTLLKRLTGLEGSEQVWKLSMAILNAPTLCQEIDIIKTACSLVTKSPFYTSSETMGVIWRRADRYGQFDSQYTPFKVDPDPESDDGSVYDVAGASCIYLLSEHPYIYAKTLEIEARAKSFARENPEAENHWLQLLGVIAPERVEKWEHTQHLAGSFLPSITEVLKAELNNSSYTISGAMALVSGINRGAPAVVKAGLFVLAAGQMSCLTSLFGVVEKRVRQNSLSQTQLSQLRNLAAELRESAE